MGQVGSVGYSYPKADNCTHISKNSVFDLFFDLTNELISDRKVQSIFPCLREYLGKVRGGEILELVDIEVKVTPCLLRNVLPTHGCH